jgi:hypothetical protein
MGMHLEPPPTGKPEYDDNELFNQNLERRVHEVEAEHAAKAHPDAGAKQSFWKRLFNKK